MATPPQPRRRQSSTTRPAQKAVPPIKKVAPVVTKTKTTSKTIVVKQPGGTTTGTTSTRSANPATSNSKKKARKAAPPITPTDWKKYTRWILWGVLALLVGFLVYKYRGPIGNFFSLDGGTSVPFKQIPVSADTPAGATLESSVGGTNPIVKMMANPSGGGSSVIVAFSTNVTVTIGGIPHRTGTDNVRIHEATPPVPPTATPIVAPSLPTPPPPAPPVLPIWPRDFAPDKELTVLKDCCDEGRVIVPPGKYHLFHLPPQAGWKVTPIIWGPGTEEFDTAINGMAVNKDPGTPFSGIRTYGFRNNSSQDLEILFKFSKRPGWVARQFGAR